jgi:hypothetical protein
MQTPKAKETIVELKFDEAASRIHTYLGRVYIKNSNDFKDQHFHLDDSSEEWLINYIKPHHVKDVAEEYRHNYIGQSILYRTNSVLKELMGLFPGVSNTEYQAAVNRCPSALAWARGLRQARNSVDWWFANGCPLEDKDLQQVIEWSEQEGWSNEVVASRSIATTILRVRRKKSEMETSSESR